MVRIWVTLLPSTFRPAAERMLEGSRELLDRRNDEIRLAYSNGEDILSLSERYCLCEDSIRKILKKNRAG